MDETNGTPAPEATASEPVAPPAAPAPPASAAPAELDSNTRMMALLSWIFAPLGIIFLFMDQYKSNKWLRQHAIQAAAVWLVGAILSSVTFGIAWVLCIIYQIVMGLKANNGGSVEVPVVYGIVKGMIDG